MLNHNLRNLYSCVLSSLLDSLLALLGLSLALSSLLQVGADISLQLIQSLEGACLLGKLIIQGRQNLSLDALDSALEHCWLALQLLSVILLREGYVYILLLANLGADQLILKARNEAVGADLQRVVLALAAGKSLAINKALEVQGDEIILCHLGAFLSLNHISLTIQHTGQLQLNCLVINSILLNLNLQALVLAQLNLRLLGSSCLEHQILAQLLGNNLELRAGNDVDFLLLQCIKESLWCSNLYSLINDIFLAYMALYNHLWSLALAEARDVHLAGNLLVCSLISLIQLCSRYSDFKFNLRVLQILYVYFHCV